MDPYIELAKKAIEAFTVGGKVLEVPSDFERSEKQGSRAIARGSYLPKEMLSKRAGVFVTLHKKPTKELRGCVGTFLPTCKNIAAEIIQNAISSSTKDRRFPPVSPSELKELEIKVDILSKPEPVTVEQLDPQKYGLIVKGSGFRMGLLLPNIPQIQTKEQQIQICKQKAFIGEDEPVELFRFSVERHESHTNS